MGLISKIPPDPFTISAFIIAYALIEDLTVTEQDSLGNWFQLLGQTLETYSSQATAVQQPNNNNQNNMDLNKLANILNKMQEEINRLKKEGVNYEK